MNPNDINRLVTCNRLVALLRRCAADERERILAGVIDERLAAELRQHFAASR